MSSEIYTDNNVMATTEEVQADACKALKEHRRVAEERMKAAEEKDLQIVRCMLQERSATSGHSSQASHSTIYQQHNQGNTQCGHFITLGFL
jgi:hypothetical protein